VKISKLPISEEQLIETVRSYYNPYYPADKYYHDILRKDNAWEEISARIKCPGTGQIIIILHGSTSQKTILNIILAAV
jgi:hypothetical protein